jgi:peptidoglycan-associated lipoprotein
MADTSGDLARKPANREPAAAQPAAKKEATPESLYFTFDSFQLDPRSKEVLQSVAREAKKGAHDVRIEGNCDERGTTEYNIALGDRRANAAVEYLERLGVAKDRIVSVSYGSEKPRFTGHDEDAWAKNRRDDVHVQ